MAIVSPARAGMDPARTSGNHGEFPPPRGDGPFPPARAGMDPRRAAGVPVGGEARRLPTGFPRTRGDGPGDTIVHERAELFPPHARGWTVIDCHVPESVCFPRTRGDGPLSQIRSELVEAFPPHARGWTRSRGRPPMMFPPHARGWTLPGLTDPSVRAFPPHARGWTRQPISCWPRGWTGQGAAGFPPHARGWTVNPGADSREASFPRTRGDGPPGVSLNRSRGEVSPARAGMDPAPHRVPKPASRSRFPRTRGDGPEIGRRPAAVAVAFPPHARGWTRAVVVGRRADPFPPHARGWTPGRRRHHHAGGVSPARAGMDRCRADRSPTYLFPPHARGWTPEARMPRKREFPPHARGWTRTGRWESRGESLVTTWWPPPSSNGCSITAT